MRSLPAWLAAAVACFVVACGASPDPLGGGEQTPAGDASEGAPADDGALDDLGDGAIVAADDSVPVIEVPETLASATTLVTTANLNLRKGPSTGYGVLAVIPNGSTVTRLDTSNHNGWFHIAWNGVKGYSSSAYLRAKSSGGSGSVSGAPSPKNAVARAKASVGFSYWWGGGAWLAGGPSSKTRGSCKGSCPSCSHSGHYGADCSGMVAKAWQFGVKALSTNSHPYSTASFVHDAKGKWKTVSRSKLKAGDALVYNSGGAGHIVLWEKGDGWGSSTVYECKGCSYGCVHDTRTFSSAYHGIRRAGF